MKLPVSPNLIAQQPTALSRAISLSLCRQKKERKRRDSSRSRSRSPSHGRRKRHADERRRGASHSRSAAQADGQARHQQQQQRQQQQGMSMEEAAAWEAVAEALDAGEEPAEGELAGYNPAAYDWDAFLGDDAGGEGSGNELAVREGTSGPVAADSMNQGYHLAASMRASTQGQASCGDHMRRSVLSATAPSTPPSEMF
jgi:hypothetical protein